MGSLGIAIVGCGDVSMKHVQAINKISECELVAVCDKDPVALNKLIEKTGVRGYRDYLEMLKNSEIDIVNICTPSDLHCGQILEAAGFKKHVLVEKPVAVDLKEIDCAIEVCENNNILLGVVHQNRFNKPVESIYRAFEEGSFGDITHISASIRRNRNYMYYESKPWRKSRKRGGGVLANQGIHNLDIIRWIMGPVDEVFAYSSSYSNYVDGEEVCAITLKFSCGALGVIEAASTVYPADMGETLSVFGKTGTVILGGNNIDEVVKWEFKDPPDRGKQPENRLGTHTDVIRDMVNSVKNGKKPKVTGEDARKGIELLAAIYKSSEQGLPVKFPLI